MKMRALLLTAVLLALVPGAVVAHGGTEVVVRGDVRPNALIEIEGEAFAPKDNVRIELIGSGTEPLELGRVRTDADGAFLASLHVPASVQPGLYRLEAVGVESASVEVTVVEPPGEGEGAAEQPRSVSRDRPAEETVALAVATGLAAAGGGALLWLSRTRPHREDRASESGRL